MDLTPTQILTEVNNAYAQCRTYRDEGFSTTVYLLKNARFAFGRPFLETRQFRIAFARPGRLRCDTFERGTSGTTYRSIHWASGKNFVTWRDDGEGAKREKSLGLMMAVAKPEASDIVALLLPKRNTSRRITELADAIRLDDADLHGVTCIRLKGSFIGWPHTLWIDKTSFLIRRIENQLGNDDGLISEHTKNYFPSLNLDIAPNELAFELWDEKVTDSR